MNIYISIHAPRVGSVKTLRGGSAKVWNFNPRSPGGERHQRRSRLPPFCGYFNPRSPGGERPPENKKKFAEKLEVLLEFQEPSLEHRD